MDQRKLNLSLMAVLKFGTTNTRGERRPITNARESQKSSFFDCQNIKDQVEVIFKKTNFAGCMI